MPAIDVRTAIRVKNNVRRGLLNDYVSIQFLEMDEDTEKLSAILAEPLTDGWSYYPATDTFRGPVLENIKIVDSPIVRDALAYATACDLYKADGSFQRFYFKAPVKPKPPTYEWTIELSPNEADKTIA